MMSARVVRVVVDAETPVLPCRERTVDIFTAPMTHSFTLAEKGDG
jgi:hypothetical protein